ncbi:uncharacterized protein LOC125881224 [Epinephelus fuscoguttatus]|uniref:uncharacterized protein LOC125881224 n=1 Tax=Epinephelus fuscoguttatus TaxID=293821 RepID=UPI0020D1B391|nr:uncharacterized protein LOC125881224 [Epinephelus fuscoguttatus]
MSLVQQPISLTVRGADRRPAGVFLHSKFPSVKYPVSRFMDSGRVTTTTDGVIRPLVLVKIFVVKRYGVESTLEGSAHLLLSQDFQRRHFVVVHGLRFVHYSLRSDDDITMLIKTKIDNEQKYVKISQPSLEEFLNSAFMKFSIPPVSEGIRVYDETGTEVDADVFEEVLKHPNAGVFTITFDNGSQGKTLSSSSQDTSSSAGPPLLDVSNSALEISACSSDDTVFIDEDYCPSRKRSKSEKDAKFLVECALTTKPGGDRILKEYSRTKGLTDSSRRQMINILAADMTETHGTAPPRRVREKYAQGIVSLFPNLKDPYSKNGYEHFYDAESGSGYLAWRLKTIQRKSASTERRGSSRQLTGGGPTARREVSFSPEMTLSEDQCREAISFLKHSSDEAAIKHKMKLTFQYRTSMVLDEEKSTDVLTEFPRFKDIKGLIEQDFVLLFERVQLPGFWRG